MNIRLVVLLAVFVTFMCYCCPKTNASAQDSLIETVLKIKNSVVEINAVKRFDDSGKALPDQVGAGLIISPDGYIITNLHTVKFARQIFVQLRDRSLFFAKVAHIEGSDDLVLLKVEVTYPLKAIRFANSDQLRLGQEVIHIGSSGLLKETISGGKITALGTRPSPTPGALKGVALFQVGLYLYKGDSGGPVLNRAGQLIGLITGKDRKKRRAGYVIPSNKIARLVLDYKKKL